MRRIIAVTVALITTNSVATVASASDDFWSELFWRVIEFIRDSGGIWNL